MRINVLEEIGIIFYLFSINHHGYHSLYINFVFVLKKLPQYLLISAIFKSIFYGLTTILIFFNLNPLYLIIFVWILLFLNFCFSSYKEEYIIVIIFISFFWYIMSNYILLDIISQFEFIFNEIDICFLFSNFNSNYCDLLTFNSCDEIKNFIDLKEKQFKFNFVNFIFDMINSWFSAELKETEQYDVLGGVQKLVVQEKFYSKSSFYTLEIIPIDLFCNDHNNYDNKILFEDTYEEKTLNINKNKELIRSLFFEKIKNQGGLTTTNLNLSLSEELKKVTYELEAYEAQKQKFKSIIINIDNDKEEFYPSEAKYLFVQYIEVIEHLLEELNSRKFNIISKIPLPEQTKDEIHFLVKDKEIKSLNPENIPLPEQTEEEINSLLEPEDFMYDALNSMNMFVEDKQN